jgi:UDP-2,3-diacylglucosamine pyrophosphatase LpxH
VSPSSQPPPIALHDIVVVSDLHLGRGRNPTTGRYHRLEAFFYDEDFLRFCRHQCDDALRRGVFLKLVLNGDTFDLLRIEPESGPGSTARERRYGPTMTPVRAALTVGEILAGHPAFVEGLAGVLQAGHELIFLPGNHDIELQWPHVQAVIRGALIARVRDRAGETAAVEAERRLTFKPWFHYEPGRVWIEHGCQYDPDNSFNYFLRRGRAALPDEIHEAEQDFPLGSFFQRYLYNPFGNLTFIVPTSQANARYFKWLLMHRPRILMRVAVSHAPFLAQLARRLARTGSSARREIARIHQEELGELARDGAIGDAVYRIDSLKNVQPDIARAISDVTRQFVKFVALALTVAFFGAGLWFAGFHAINQLQYGFGFKAALFLALNFLLLTGATVGIAYVLFRTSSHLETGPMKRAAEQIATTLDVPLVTFGHSHEETVQRLARTRGDGWYYNTGTWIAVFTHDVLLPRERVQFTYLHIKQRDASLLYWSAARSEPAPVILLEDEDAYGEPLRPTETTPG